MLPEKNLHGEKKVRKTFGAEKFYIGSNAGVHLLLLYSCTLFVSKHGKGGILFIRMVFEQQTSSNFSINTMWLVGQDVQITHSFIEGPRRH